jgi:hypothetical protein
MKSATMSRLVFLGRRHHLFTYCESRRPFLRGKFSMIEFPCVIIYCDTLGLRQH